MVFDLQCFSSDHFECEVWFFIELNSPRTEIITTVNATPAIAMFTF